MQKIPYILVVGDKETQNKTVNVRHRGQLAFAAPSPKLWSVGDKATAGKEDLSTEAKAKVEEIKLEKFLEQIKKEILEKFI